MPAREPMAGFYQPGLIAAMISMAAVGFWLVRRRPRTHKAPAASHCPSCSQPYGDDILVNVVPIHYRWVVARGETRQSLNLPQTTHLVTCPQCLAEYEFRENGEVFEHPQHGVLSCVRNGRTRAVFLPRRRAKITAAG
jgi:hypothetical protein